MSQYPGTSNPNLQADVLLVTVTAIETVAVRRLFSTVQRHFIGNRTYYDLGEVGGAKVFLVRSEIGTGGQGGAILSIQKGIDELSPSAIIMVGIAFGVDPTKQKIGDILVSKQIIYYELQRVGSEPDQKLVIISRGDKAAASPRLLNRFRAGEIEWEETNETARIMFGLILSGAKLVDTQDFREQIRAVAPEAIGGEMEGEGLYLAAQSNKVDWILVKAIGDWADGNRSVNKEANQELAATNAARLIRYVIEQGGLRSERRYNPANVQTQPSQPQSNKKPDVTKPINVFISYAEEDERFKQELETHLTQLKQEKVILTWDSQKIKIGTLESREEQIVEHIDSAQIVLLLMSPNFLASDQLYENEMMRAIDRRKAGHPVRVIPIAVRYIAPGDPNKLPYQKLQGLPRNGRPIESWGSASDAWATIAQEIREVCNDLRFGRKKW